MVTYSGGLASTRLFIEQQCSSEKLLSCIYVFILGMWYLGLGVLRHVFGVGYGGMRTRHKVPLLVSRPGSL